MFEELLAKINKLKPKEIDLSKYGTSSSNIANAVIALVGQGGGNTVIDDVGRFWEDVNTEAQLELKLDYMSGQHFVIPSPIIFRNENGVMQVAFSVLLNNNGTLLDLKVNITYKGNAAIYNPGAYITVKVS